MLADRWTFLIIREAYSGVHRYGQLQRNLGIARNILAERLSSSSSTDSSSGCAIAPNPIGMSTG